MKGQVGGGYIFSKILVSLAAKGNIWSPLSERSKKNHKKKFWKSQAVL